ncbi:hypothetical protein GCM10009626_34400 [Brachybacterium sacelli]
MGGMEAVDPSPTPTPHAPSRRVLLLAGAAAAAVAGTVAAGTILTRGDGAATAASAVGGGAMDPSTTGSFLDVPENVEGREAMVWAHTTGVQPALNGSRYAPDQVVTRGDLAVALHRFAGSPAVPLADTPALLADLGEDPDRAAALLWLYGQGALWGDASLQVHPERSATRDDTAGLLAALLRPALAGVGATWVPSADAPTSQSQSQSQSAEPWSSLADARWLEAAGMVPDAPPGTLWAGKDDVTRADLAICLHRADTAIAGAMG